jgi:hypothetical protein
MRRIIGTTAALCALLFTLAWISAAPQQPKAKNTKASAALPGGFGNADAITEDELKVYDYFLASDQLEGRNTPSRGYDTAALYVASHLKEWGLKPGGSTTGTDGPMQPYFMPIELVSNQLDASGMKLSLVVPPPAARGGRGGAGAGAAGGGGRGAGVAAAPAGPRGFEYGKEWTVGAGGGGFGGFGGGGRGGGAVEPADVAGSQLVFVGNGYVINKTNTNPYQGIDVRGKFLVVAGVPPELAAAQQAAMAARGAAAGAGAGRGRGGAPPNPLGVENTDFMTPQGYAVKNGAVGVIMVPTFQQLSAMANPPAARGVGPNGPPYQVVKFQPARTPSVPTITAGIELTNALFQGEKLSAVQVFDGGSANAKLESFELNAEKKLSLHIAVTSEYNHTEDVIGILEGSDPVLKNEYVVMSGHLDHLGLSAPINGDTVFNGADDDGSGSTAVLGLAHAFAEGAAKGIRPKRTMIFLWVTGEEKGLWGSQYFNEFPPIDITKVVGDLNMDMIGRTKTPGYVDPPQYKLVEPNEIFVVGPNISSDDLEKMLETVNNSLVKMKINHFYDVTAPDETHDNLGPQPNGQRIFYRSDHYNFAKMGIPIAFFTTGLHPDYHRVTDSPEKIDYHEIQIVSKTVAALAWVLGNTATPPKLNAKLPELLINDMKTVQAQGWGKLTAVLPPLPGMPF